MLAQACVCFLNPPPISLGDLFQFLSWRLIRNIFLPNSEFLLLFGVLAQLRGCTGGCPRTGLSCGASWSARGATAALALQYPPVSQHLVTPSGATSHHFSGISLNLGIFFFFDFCFMLSSISLPPHFKTVWNFICVPVYHVMFRVPLDTVPIKDVSGFLLERHFCPKCDCCSCCSSSTCRWQATSLSWSLLEIALVHILDCSAVWFWRQIMEQKYFTIVRLHFLHCKWEKVPTT